MCVSLTTDFWGDSCCSISNYLRNVLYIVVCSFLLAIVLSFLLQLTVSDYPFGIFKLFLNISPSHEMYDDCLSSVSI